MGRIWTAEEREKQAIRIKNQRPWMKSTGPRTQHGRKNSSRNAWKHGVYGIEFKSILLYLREQRHYIETLRLCLKMGIELPPAPKIILGNELNETRTKPIKNDTTRHINVVVFVPQINHVAQWDSVIKGNRRILRRKHSFSRTVFERIQHTREAEAQKRDACSPKDKIAMQRLASNRNPRLPIRLAGGQST